MKQFWHEDITEKSFRTLIQLNKKYNFILIGGWAVYLWSKKMKSKDIDIVLDFTELGRLKLKYKLQKNDRLNKYEINFREFDIDIYLPNYSKIGFPLEKLKDYTQNIEGFTVPKIEVLLFLKLYAYKERKHSIKGEKDKIDIIGLIIAVEINWQRFVQICNQYSIDLINELKKILSETKRVDELGLNDQQMSKLRNSVEGLIFPS